MRTLAALAAAFALAAGARADTRAASLEGPTRALVYEEGGWLYRARVDGTRPLRLVRGEWPELSPDGRWVSFERRKHGSEAHDVHVLALSSGHGTVVARGVHDSDWLPDSSRLVVSGPLGARLVDRRGGSGRLLVQAQTEVGFLSGASLASAGDLLVFTRWHPETEATNIFSAALAGGEPVQLTSDGDSTSPLAGRRLIAFRRTTPLPGDRGSTDLWVMRRDGSGTRQVTTNGRGLEPVFWLPGERALVAHDVSHTLAGDYYFGQLVIVEIASGATRPLTRMLEGLTPLDLSRDGRALLYRTGCTHFSLDPTRRPGGLHSVPVAGGKPRVLLDGPCSAGWSR